MHLINKLVFVPMVQRGQTDRTLLPTQSYLALRNGTYRAEEGWRVVSASYDTDSRDIVLLLEAEVVDGAPFR